MNVLIVCIFNNTYRNNKLIQIHRKYSIKHEHIDYYFITYDEHLEDEFKLVDDILFIKGTENYMNILKKTLKAFFYFENIQPHKKYDFIIRTNISSIINFNILYENLKNMPKSNVYNGGILLQLKWLDEKVGINEMSIENYSLKDLFFIQGTLIIFSYDVFKFMLNNIDKFKYDIIDDVSIGLFVKTYCPDACVNMRYTFGITTAIITDTAIYDTKCTLYRHKSFDDELDIQNMINTYEKLLC